MRFLCIRLTKIAAKLSSSGPWTRQLWVRLALARVLKPDTYPVPES